MFRSQTSRVVAGGKSFLEPLEDRLLMRTLGIDVSHYQTVSSWANVYSAGERFVFIKATEGASTNDANLAANESGATNAGLITGVYHFAHPGTNSATTEANHFLSVAQQYMGAGYLRPVLDVETTTLSKSATSTWVNTFCQTVANATGFNPIVYTGASFASTYLDSTVTNWTPWIASYNGQSSSTGNPTSTTPWSSWSFWQYTDSASISGISTTDADVYANSVDTLISTHVGPSSQFSTGQTVHVTATSLKAWDTYASNGTYVTEPNGKTGVIQGKPVYIAGYLRWPIKYSGDTVTRWSAGDYLAAGAGTMVVKASAPSAASSFSTTPVSSVASSIFTSSHKLSDLI